MVRIPPGNVGQRLLPSYVDEIARDDPSRILYSIVKTKNPADGFQDITAKAFAQAVDRCAWHLEKTLGHGHNFSTLLYMGPQDVVYAILVCLNRSDHPLSFDKPSNSQAFSNALESRGHS